MLGVEKTYGLLSKTIGFKFSFVYHLSFVIEKRFLSPPFTYIQSDTSFS